jgi:hypothetical protein
MESLLGNGIFNSDGMFGPFVSTDHHPNSTLWFRGYVEVNHVLHLNTHRFDLLTRFHRSITRPFFTKDRVSDFENFERHTQAALKSARARLAEGFPIDFQVLCACPPEGCI